MRAFTYGKTIHAQPLSEKGRETYDRIFPKKKEEDKKENRILVPEKE